MDSDSESSFVVVESEEELGESWKSEVLEDDVTDLLSQGEPEQQNHQGKEESEGEDGFQKEQGLGQVEDHVQDQEVTQQREREEDAQEKEAQGEQQQQQVEEEGDHVDEGEGEEEEQVDAGEQQPEETEDEGEGEQELGFEEEDAKVVLKEKLQKLLQDLDEVEETFGLEEEQGKLPMTEAQEEEIKQEQERVGQQEPGIDSDVVGDEVDEMMQDEFVEDDELTDSDSEFSDDSDDEDEEEELSLKSKVTKWSSVLGLFVLGISLAAACDELGTSVQRLYSTPHSPTHHRFLLPTHHRILQGFSEADSVDAMGGFKPLCASGELCTVSQNGVIRFGSDKRWIYHFVEATKDLPVLFTCSPYSFGVDPDSSVGKTCTFKAVKTRSETSGENGFSFLCREHENCRVTQDGTVAFTGTNGYVERRVKNNDVFNCHKAFFRADPSIGEPKTCRFKPSVMETPLEHSDEYKHVCNEYSECKVNQAGTFRYGYQGRWTYKDVLQGGVYSCNNGFFGRDPYRGKFKKCYFKAKETERKEGSGRDILALESRIQELERLVAGLVERATSKDDGASSTCNSEEHADSLAKYCNQFRTAPGGALQDYYKVVGVRMQSKEKDIRQAINNKQRRLKSGKGSMSPLLLEEAASVLLNKGKRGEYDTCVLADQAKARPGSWVKHPTKKQHHVIVLEDKSCSHSVRQRTTWSPLQFPIVLDRVVHGRLNTIKLAGVPADATSVRASISCSLGYEIAFQQGKLVVWSEDPYGNRFSISADLTVSPQDSFNNVQQTSWLPVFQNRYLLAVFEDKTFLLSGASECKVFVDAYR